MKERLYLSVGAGERGQTMVEMALVLPLFLILVFAIIEMGRAWAAKQSLTIAAQEGARILLLPYGPKPPHSYDSEDAVKSAALDAVRDAMNGSGVPVTPATQIAVVRITPGPNGIYDGVTPQGDDVLEPNYSGGQRGDRVGIQITYPFETPVPMLLSMFANPHDPQGSPGATPTQSAIKMSMTCYMDHE